MAGKSNLSATLFAQKKLLGKANTSVVKSDAQEVIGSNIQVAAQTIFSEDIPDNPAQTLYLLQSASNGSPTTVEFVQFDLEAISGTTYDANTYDNDSKIGNPQDAGPHAYKLKLSASYQSLSSNSNKGNGVYNNSKTLFETIGALQIVPPNFSGQSPNPYILKLYKGDPSQAVNEIPLLDELDWTIDYYNGILFLQDYDASKIPLYARGFIYTGKMLSASLGSSGGGGDITAVTAGSGLTGGASTGAATLNVGAGTGITVNANDVAINNSVVATLTGSIFSGPVSAPALTGSLTKLADGSNYLLAGTNVTLVTGSNGAVTISSSGGGGSVNGRSKTTYYVTASHSTSTKLDISGADFSSVVYDENKIDVSLNGQLLHTGSKAQVDSGARDYSIASANSLYFGWQLEPDDIVDVIVSVVGAGAGGGGDAAASYLVLGNTGSLSNERRLIAGTGINSADGGANSSYTLSIDNSVVATLSGSEMQSSFVLVSDNADIDNGRVLTAGTGITISTSNPREITINSSGLISRSKVYTDITSSHAANQPLDIHTVDFSSTSYSSSRIDVFLNGMILRSGSNYDYELQPTGSVLFKQQLEPDDSILVITF